MRRRDDKAWVPLKGDFMKDRFLAYLKDETGQTSTEYILLVAVVATIVFKFKTAIIKKLGLGPEGGGIMGAALNESNFADFGNINN